MEEARPDEKLRAAAPRRESSAHILIVDDEEFIRGSFKLYFESVGFNVSVADGGDSALAVFGEKAMPVDVVLLDLVMPGTSGIDVLRQLKELNDDVEVIIATGCGSMHSAVEALRYGAYDYITKPIVNFDDDLLRVVEQALAERAQRLAKRRLLEAADPAGDLPPATDAAAFYRELESLAREVLSPMSRAESAAALGSFLGRLTGVKAAAVLERREGGAIVPLGRWGAFAGDRRADALLAPGSQWLRSLPARTGWTRLPPEDPSLDLLDAAGGVDFVRISIPGPARSGAARDVIFLRRAGDAGAARAPDVGLLALVAERSVG